DVPCVGEMTGAATINIDQAGTYTYDWPGNIPDERTVTGLPAGQYNVTVTDESGCGTTTRVRINEPDGAPLDVLVTIGQPIACFGEDSAILLTEIQGGTSDYRFLWNNDSEEERLVGVGEGTYSVTVTDMNGCVAESNAVEIIEPDSELVVEANSTNETAVDEDDGAARVIISGGVEPYETEWSHGPMGETVTNLEPGEYTWTVTDANGCVVEGTIVIEEAASCIPFAVEISTTNATCSTNADGRAEVTSAAGIEPFIYEWFDGSTGTFVDSLPAGTYEVTITDSEACPVVQEITIGADSIDLNLTVLGVDCEGSANGNATLAPTGGAIPYTYAWSINIDSLAIEAADSLDVGDYSVTVTDANGCVEMTSFTIEIGEDRTPPTIVSESITIYLDEFGEAAFELEEVSTMITDNCGTVDTMSIERTMFTCDDLGINQVMLSATDNSGNTASMMLEVSVLDTLAPILDCMLQDTLIDDCLADRTITFDLPQVMDNCGQSLTPVLISGLESGSFFPAGQTEQIFEVIDSSGNAATCSFIVDVDVLGVTIEAEEPTCFGFADGTLKATTINTTGEIFYSWNNGGDVDSLGGLSAGEYTVTVIDASGCSSVETVELTQPDLLTADIDLIYGSSEDAAEGAIFVTVEGGVPPYSYQWTIDATQIITGQGDPDLVDIRRGDYRLAVFDRNGCVVNTDLIELRGDTVVDNSNTYLDYEVSIYPNPTSGEISFQIAQDQVRAYSVALYDITGRLIKNLATEELNRSERVFDLSAYENGMYFLRVQVEDQVLTKRIVLLKE
ncbi:MAG: T9SS type A sorting domain-containing protein, partial [Bacteroidota bacterium]